jgi:hypothetical protein
MEDFEYFEEQIDEAFDNVATVFVPLDGEEIQLTSMSEIPVDKMLEFVMSDNNEKLALMFGLVEMCVVNPEDFKKIQVLNTKRFMRFVDDWTTKSSKEALGEDEDE